MYLANSSPEAGRRRVLLTSAQLAVVTMLVLAITFTGLTAAAEESNLVTGKRIFRFDTFGDEQFWTDTLRLNEVIETSLDPITALELGLKVDADALPADLVDA